MIIRSCTEEVMENICEGFARYPIQVTDAEGDLYNIRISDEIPYILKYNAPMCILEIGATRIDFNKDEVFNIEIM